MKILVLGAGISGLTAAYRLNRLRPEWSISVWERRPRVGGVLETMSRDGCQLELSADNFITTVPWGLSLCRELGLEDDIVPTRPEYRRTYVVRRGRLHLLPDGFLMMAPTRFLPMALTPLLSPWGKLRAGCELFVPARRDDGDESMAAFVRRRLGREVFERLVEPLVSGVYAADMERLSVMATLPRFREMERDHGSLLWGMQRQRWTARSHNTTASAESGARYSMFVTLRSGLSHLTDTLAARLPAGAIHTGREAVRLEASNSCWSVTDQQGRTEHFDALVLAIPAHEAARLLLAHNNLSNLSQKLSEINYEGTAIVSLAFEAAQIKQRLTGMGFVVPQIEISPILAGSFSSLKYAHRAPEGKMLLRLFAGGHRMPYLAQMPAEDLLPLLLAELRPLLKINGDPLWAVTSHWANTMPQYHVGHRERIAELERLVSLTDHPPLALCGSYFRGVGIPQCIKSGDDAAHQISAANLCTRNL